MADGRLRALIVDDEPAARTRLSLLCAKLPRLEVVGIAGDGDGGEALARLDCDPIDLLFLDIEMPGMSLARRLGERDGAPAVVFVTAFERFAVAAFGVHAAGYLLKLVDPEILAAVVDRLAARPDRFRSPPPTASPVFWAPHRGDLVPIPARDVEWVEAEGDYVHLHLHGRSYLLSERLYDLGERLAAWRFVHVHRSALVNLDQVRALAHMGKGLWLIRTHAGTELPIGRSHLGHVRAALSR